MQNLSNDSCSCITARRRRKAGAKPFYGTGWAARPGQYNAQPYYNNNNNQDAYAPPPPQYTPNPNQQSQYGPQYGANQGYYGQQNGVELQPPQQAYRGDGGESGYAPPAGPPPGKGGDGIIR
jgi:hypothetical protein